MKEYLAWIMALLICIQCLTTLAASYPDGVAEYNPLINSFDMVIIAPNMFSDVIQPLIDHKNTIGITTVLNPIEDIVTSYHGRDDAEKIKYSIKDYIETYHIDYVLLIGDIDLVPIRRSALSWDYFGTYVVKDIITDFYYSDIYEGNGSFSSWDTNNDGIYGEIKMITIEKEDNESFFYTDHIDTTPDISVGRLPCSSSNEVKIVVNKIINYETGTFGSDWFKRIVLMGGDTFPFVGDMSEGEFVTEYISSIMPEFTPVRLWTSLGTFTPLRINKEISQGAGFVSYSGHGFQYGFGTSSYNSDNIRKYYTPYILGIQNQQRYPIFYFDACWTAALDYTFLQSNAPCFAWALMKKQNGGAIACIGSTRVAYGGLTGDPFGAGSPCLQGCFFEAYEPGVHIGDMFREAQEEYISKVWDSVFMDALTIQEFILIGDPSLKVGGYHISEFPIMN